MDGHPPRPECVRHWREIESAERATHPKTGETRGYYASFSRALGLRRLGVHHLRLMPGERSSPPHAERDEEEYALVLEGTPDLYTDGWLTPLKPLQSVGWPNGTGIAHCLINNTGKPVRMLIIGEASRYVSQVFFPSDRELNLWAGSVGKLWSGHPVRSFGPHDGKADAVRGTPAPPQHFAKRKPPFVIDWKAIQGEDNNHYPGSDELLAVGARVGRQAGLARLGIWIDELKPGRRSSFPHAEADEEEFVFVLQGNPHVWLDGHLHQLEAGDCVGWPDRTGLSHVVINNSDKTVRLLVAGEASRQMGRVYYPLNPERMAELKAKNRDWVPEGKRKLGPHDGLPDALREALAAKVKRKAKTTPVAPKGAPRRAAKPAANKAKSKQPTKLRQ